MIVAAGYSVTAAEPCDFRHCSRLCTSLWTDDRGNPVVGTILACCRRHAEVEAQYRLDAALDAARADARRVSCAVEHYRQHSRR